MNVSVPPKLFPKYHYFFLFSWHDAVVRAETSVYSLSPLYLLHMHEESNRHQLVCSIVLNIIFFVLSHVAVGRLSTLLPVFPVSCVLCSRIPNRGATAFTMPMGSVPESCLLTRVLITFCDIPAASVQLDPTVIGSIRLILGLFTIYSISEGIRCGKKSRY